MDRDYLIQKKPLNALVLFSLPIIIGNLFQQTYTMADSAIVGRYVGEQALAAVGASYSLTNIFICVAIGGGTYVHHLKSGVAFGAAMPETENRMHGPDEFAVVDELLASAKIFAQVIAELCR